MPTSIQAGFYSATKRYLEAIKEAGTDDADKVMAVLKKEPFDDPVFGKSYDPRRTAATSTTCICSRSRSPAESKGPWDYYKLHPHDPRRRGVPPDGPGRVPAGEEGIAS